MAKTTKLGPADRFREEFDSEVLGWPEVTTRRMFGCPCYLAKGKMFAFFVTDGLVLTCLDADGWDGLSRVASPAPFEYGGKVVAGWAHVDISGMSAPGPLMESVRESCGGALLKADAPHRGDASRGSHNPRRRTRRTGS